MTTPPNDGAYSTTSDAKRQAQHAAIEHALDIIEDVRLSAEEVGARLEPMEAMSAGLIYDDLIAAYLRRFARWQAPGPVDEPPTQADKERLYTSYMRVLRLAAMLASQLREPVNALARDLQQEDAR